MRALHFDPFSGIAGNMTLASLIHAGLPVDYLNNELSKLNLDENFRLKINPSKTSGISGIQFDVEITKKQEHHRHYSDIVEIIEKSLLPKNTKDLALRFFKIIGEAEAKIHQIPLDHVHFHEVGAIDSIVDLIGVAIGIDYFKPEKITSSPVPQGVGEIKCEHGVMPNPAPATVEILSGVPIYTLPIPKELTTPTGAAIIKGLAESFQFPDSFQTKSIGYGIGSFEFQERPNFLRIFIGEVEDSIGVEEGEITKIEVNIDDMSPQLYEPLIQSLFQAGAIDVAIFPIQMKKHRPANRVEILLNRDKFDAVTKALFLNSTTIGFRYETLKRRCLTRKISQLETPYGLIPIKESYLGNRLVQATPEYDTCVEISRKTNLPVKEIIEKANVIASSSVIASEAKQSR